MKSLLCPYLEFWHVALFLVFWSFCPCISHSAASPTCMIFQPSSVMSFEPAPVYLLLLHFCIIVDLFGLHFCLFFRPVSIILHFGFVAMHFFKGRRGFAFLALLFSCMFTFHSHACLLFVFQCFWSLCYCTFFVRWRSFNFCFLCKVNNEEESNSHDFSLLTSSVFTYNTVFFFH